MEKDNNNFNIYKNLDMPDVFLKTGIITNRKVEFFLSDKLYYLHFILDGRGVFKYGSSEPTFSIPLDGEMIFLSDKDLPHSIEANDEVKMLTIGFMESIFKHFPSFISIQNKITKDKVIFISNNWYMFAVLVEDLNSFKFRYQKHSSMTNELFQSLLFRTISEIAGCQILSNNISYSMDIESPRCKVKIKKKINLMPPFFFGAYIILRDDFSSDKFYFHEDYAMFLVLEGTGCQEYIKNKEIKKIEFTEGNFFFWNGKIAHRIVNSQGTTLKLLYIHFTPDYLEEYAYSYKIHELFKNNPCIIIDENTTNLKKIKRYMGYIEKESELCGQSASSIFKSLLREIFNELIAAYSIENLEEKTMKIDYTPPPLIVNIGLKDQYDLNISNLKNQNTLHHDFCIHPYYRLYLVIDGEGYHEVYENKVLKKYKVRKYMFFLWDNVLPYKIDDTPGNHLVQRLVRFDPEQLKAFPFFNLILRILKKDHFLHGYCTPVVFRRIINLMDRMRFSNATDDYKRAIMVDILEQLYDFLEIDFEEYFDGDTDQRIIRVIKYLRNHCEKPIHLSKLKSIACLSERRLTTLFKKETGKTIMQYLKDYRLSVAKELLLINLGEKILSIALDTGFKSLQNFSYEFKKAYGISPVNFRKRYL